MARLVILGAGIAGQTVAFHARRKLGRDHEVVVSPNSRSSWIPSSTWVGVGVMTPEQVTVPLPPVYAQTGITFVRGRAVSLHPEGDGDTGTACVKVALTEDGKAGQEERVPYDGLINATGPKLDFDATPGLGPQRHSLSVCTFDHAAHAPKALDETVARMKAGEKQTLLVGTGHDSCTCQGAAFEYLFNVEFELRRRGVRDKARVVWLSNEHELGDFGMGGMFISRGGYVTHSRVFTESLYAERGIEWITRAGVKEVAPGEVSYETLDGVERSLKFDFGMLLPPLSGVRLKAFAGAGADVIPNVFAVGIAFAPPHAISKPTTSPKGTPIFPAPPRTGMPSGVMAREVALNIVDMIRGKATTPRREASLANMGAACLASAGASAFRGTAVSMTLFPIIPDFQRYPDTGRELRYTFGEIGLAGHWIKHLLHFGFLYKAKANPFWALVPE